MKKHFVVFYSPGTFFPESTTKEISSWNIKEAILLSKNIDERYGAKPFGFKFQTKICSEPVEVDGEKLLVESKVVKESGLHYIGGVVKTLDDYPDDGENCILRHNLKSNERPACETNNSYKHTSSFEKDDLCLDQDGNIICRGSDF